MEQPGEQPGEQAVARRVVLVTGPAASGVDAVAGALQALGLHAPDAAWVADFHGELLQRCNVEADDARPSAWYDAGRLADFEPLRGRLRTWLERQLTEGGPEVVVADPGLTWFAGLWRSAALRCDATPSFVLTLRAPAGALDASTAPVRATASWVNLALHTERATRGAARAIVRYDDLLTDWTVPLAGLGAALDLRSVQAAGATDLRAVHTRLESLPTATAPRPDDPDHLDLPLRLRELAESAWRHLDALAAPDGDTPAGRADLDEVRAAWRGYYADAEAITASSVGAARRAGLARLPEPALAVVRRGEDRVPRRLRAAVPGRARRALRRALGRDG